MQSVVEKRWIPTNKKIIVILSAVLLLLLGLVLILTRCDHVWMDATCEHPMTCETCGKTKGDCIEHSCIAATCTNPPICRYCIKAQGEPLGHDWQPATCSTPESCKRCSATQGSTTAHTLGKSTDGVTKPCVDCGASVRIKYVALTFDDGPAGPTTQTLLEGLDARDAKATFFLCGYQIGYHPDYPELIDSYGHEIGLHTENHAYLTKVENDTIRREIRKELERMPDIPIRLLRPPGGHFNGTVESICSSYGLSIIMWSLDTMDWDHEDPAEIVPNILKAKEGDIILMHDLKSSSVEAALQAIDIMKADGYEFVTISELAAIRDCPLYGGSVYYSM